MTKSAVTSAKSLMRSHSYYFGDKGCWQQRYGAKRRETDRKRLAKAERRIERQEIRALAQAAVAKALKYIETSD